MAAIPVEILVGAAITSASVVIPAVVTGVTLAVASSKLGHKQTVITKNLELTAGTHISYKYREGTFNSYRHAIVAEHFVAEDDVQTVKLIYWVAGQVTFEDAALSIRANGTESPVYRHEYNYSISYGREAVAVRARSLCRKYTQPERHGVIHNYWSCFDSDEQFALWCHTGIRPAIRNMVRGMFSTDFKYVKVHSMSCLLPGDHICFQSNDVWFYQHGIVVDLHASDSTHGFQSIVTVVCIKNYADRPVKINLQGSDYFGSTRSYKLYRYDYDIALGCSGELAVRNALNESRLNKERNNGPPAYYSDVDFAVWCKLSVVISPNDASTLAKARADSCLHATVGSKSDLRPGDHVDLNGQHLIVEGVTVARGGSQLEAILMPNVKPGTGSGQKIMRQTYKNVEYAIGGKQLEKYFYDNAESNINEHDVLDRARQQLGEGVNDLPFKDSQHFAMWCRTGARQVNHVSWYTPKKDL